MARQARNEVIDPTQVQILHCIHRCVRRAFLCGVDKFTGKDFEYRRNWIRRRMEFLTSVFAIDCLTFAIMHNHFHVVLRSRPDVSTVWSDEEVARRWLRLFPKRRGKDGGPLEPTREEVEALLKDAKGLAERRRRLSDVSWWMKCVAENIARRCNREDDVTGHFWEGRFKSQLILDEASLLACAAYVDLNPIRACITKTPEASRFTGAKERIDDLRCAGKSITQKGSTHAWERSGGRTKSGWLSPIQIHESRDHLGPDIDAGGRRPSQKGFLTLSLTEYLQLLDWTGRMVATKNAGAIPKVLAPILHRLGLDSHGWHKLVRDYRKIYKRAAGTAEHLAIEAKRRQLCWMQARGNPLRAAG